MKKRNSIVMFIAVAFVFAAFNSSASLPELEAPATPTPMPFTISPDGSDYGYIDVNGDSIIDFYVYCYNNQGRNDYWIEEYHNIGNLIHYTNDIVRSPVGETPLTVAYYHASVFDYGHEIGSNLSNWRGGALLFQDFSFLSPLESNFYEKDEGYLGVSFLKEGQSHYGWIQVSRTGLGELDGALTSPGSSVTFHAAAAASAPGSSILAGSGGAVVPVSIIASALGFFAIGTGLYFRKKRKKA